MSPGISTETYFIHDVTYFIYDIATNVCNLFYDTYITPGYVYMLHLTTTVTTIHSSNYINYCIQLQQQL
jgi:hypothetical protein